MFVIQSLLDKSSVLGLQGRFFQYSKCLFCLYWKISSYFQCELFWHLILAFVWLKGLPGIKNLSPDIDSHRLGSRHLLISYMIYSIDWGSKGFHCKTCFLSFLRFLMPWTTVRKVFFWKLFHFSLLFKYMSTGTKHNNGFSYAKKSNAILYFCSLFLCLCIQDLHYPL